MDCCGVMPQPTGQLERTSTSANPPPSSCDLAGASDIGLGASDGRRIRNRPSSRVGDARHQGEHLSDGERIPVETGLAPVGVEVVFCPISVVGAICPPVMP